MLQKLKKYFKNINIFILLILFLLGFAVFYFLYSRQRSQEYVFLEVNLTRSLSTVPNSTLTTSLVPYWVADAVKIGDTEVSILGEKTAEVIGKKIYEAPSSNKYVFLLLKVKAIKDRSGTFLFKNKPVSVGSNVEFKLTEAQVQGTVYYLGPRLPDHKYKNIRVILKSAALNKDIAESVKPGEKVETNGETVATILASSIETSRGQINQSGNVNYGNPGDYRTLTLTAELKVREIDKIFYFSEYQKVKANETIYLFLKNVSLDLEVVKILDNAK